VSDAIRVTITYSGSTSYKLDPDAIADSLPDAPTDEQIVEAIYEDATFFVEHGADAAPPSRGTRFDRDRAIAAVRAVIAERAEEEP